MWPRVYIATYFISHYSWEYLILGTIPININFDKIGKYFLKIIDLLAQAKYGSQPIDRPRYLSNR